MLHSKFRLSSLIVLITLIAVNLVLVRSGSKMIVTGNSLERYAGFSLLGLASPLTASSAGVCSLVWALRTRRKASGFALGFVATSLVAALSYVVLYPIWLEPGLVVRFLQGFVPKINANNASTWVPIVLAGYSIAVCAPQLLVALGGGWLFHHCGISISRARTPVEN